MRRKPAPAAKKKTEKTAAKKKTKKTAAKKKDPRLKDEEVSLLLEQLQSEERTERAWKEMTAMEHDESDTLAATEEKLISKPHESESKLRSWKHYGK